VKRWTKEKFQKHLERRYSLRLHMLLVLSATALSGILFSKMLLVFDVADFRIRYPLSVALSYLVFFVCVKLWLCCISPFKADKRTTLDWLDPAVSSGGGSGGGGVQPLRGSGGQFSGAGASGSFAGRDAAAVETGLMSTSSSPTASAASSGIGDVAADAAGAIGDDNIVLAVMVGAVLFSAVYVLYGAPAILSEAAFEGFLAASLIKKTRAMSDQSWAGSVFRGTWIPFGVTVVVTFLCGAVLHHYFPKAVSLTDILWRD
jgi:hypothetical protein